MTPKIPFNELPNEKLRPIFIVIPLKIEIYRPWLFILLCPWKHKHLQLFQGRQAIKYSRRKAAQFVFVEKPEIHLIFYHFKPLVIIQRPPWNACYLGVKIILKQGPLHRIISIFLGVLKDFCVRSKTSLRHMSLVYNVALQINQRRPNSFKTIFLMVFNHGEYYDVVRVVELNIVKILV